MAPRAGSSNLRVRRRFNDAVDSVNNGYTYREAAQTFRVPVATLHRKVKRIEKKAGRRNALNDSEEELIVNFLRRYSDRGIPLTQTHLCEALEIVIGRMDITGRLTLPFNRFRPGRAFLRAFRKRHVDKLTFGKPLRQENNRFRAVNCDVLTTHFAVLDKLIDEHGLDADHIFNLDEQGTTPDRDLDGRTAALRLMSRNGSKDYKMTAFKQLHRVTMMPVVSASGQAGPPLFFFKGSRLPYCHIKRGGTVVEQTPLSNLPHGATAALRLENGGVDTNNFRNWAYTFVEYVRPLTAGNRKVLLMYDGYRAHLSLDVLEIFYHNNIIVYALPAHTSGKTQPCDVVLFSVFKNALNTALNNCAVRAKDEELNIFHFCALLREAYEKTFTPSNIRAAFRRSGVWPLDAGQLLNVVRPATAEDNAPLMSVEELEEAFEAKKQEYRTRVLGDDAEITASGFVDTTRGCVMTSQRALQLVREKHESDKRKRAVEEQKRLERERKREAVRVMTIKKSKLLYRERMARCARLSGTTFELFIKKVRPLAERRMIARAHALEKINGQVN